MNDKEGDELLHSWYREQIKKWERALNDLPKRSPERNRIYEHLAILRKRAQAISATHTSHEGTRVLLNNFIPKTYGDW